MAENNGNDIGEYLLKIIERSIETGISEGMSRIKKQEDDKKRSAYDTRRYNTELLLKNYRNFKKHISDSVYSAEKVQKFEEERKHFKIDFDEPMDDTYIKSILKSKMTTSLLLEQIDVFLNYYRIRCLNSKREEIRRRGKVIELLYIVTHDTDGNELEDAMTFDEVAETLHISTKTVNRDRKAAIKELSALFFGIEGLKIKK